MQTSSFNVAANVLLLTLIQFWAVVEAQPGMGWEAQCIGQWLQCGGRNYWGPTNCCPGTRCEYVNEYWWQCNPSQAPLAPMATPAPTPVVTTGNTVAPSDLTPDPTAPPSEPLENVPLDSPVPSPAPTHRPHHWGHHHHPSSTSATSTATPTPFPTEAGPPFWEQDCFRVRKNILSLTPDELADFIEALQTLKASGLYDTITAIHGNPTTFNLFHGNDYFLPWHRWYVLQIESAVRDLGGKFSCFAMPYWDWTLDAGRETESPLWGIFGPMGKKNDSFCMKEGPFAEWTNSKGGCLKRIGSDSYRFFSPAEVLDLIMGKKTLVGDFRPAFEAGAHSRPHLFLGGAMNSFASPDDPIFWLHHAFVDKIWAMWQDCHRILDPANILDTDFKPDQVDVELAYAPGITTRSMWSTRELGYTYETDIMSAYTFLNTCHWSTLKPNPILNISLPAPPMPEISPETRQSPPFPEKGVTAPLLHPSTVAALADAQKHQDMRSNMTGQSSHLRGKNYVPYHKKHRIPSTNASIHTKTIDKSGQDMQAILVPTKEWAAAQAKMAPYEPHGKGLIVEENRVFTACMGSDRQDNVEKKRAECLKVVLKRDCEMLGFICDLPDTYRDGMHMEADENVFKKDSMCARSCHG